VTPLRILVLCTGNSARSQLAEALFRAEGGDRISVESAGSDPKAEIHPMAWRVASEVLGLDLTGQSPKSVARFTGERFDVVVTVCDRAAERCPLFPGAPERVHWSLRDPAVARGDEETVRRAFEDVARDLRERIRSFLQASGKHG
jgi:arsenate reductase